MPELPDVEVLRRYFDRTAVNRPIAGAQIRSEEMVGGESSSADIVSRLQGCAFHSTQRHGKYLFASFDKHWLVLHFGMTGTLAHLNDGAKEPKHTRLLLTFEDGSRMAYQCQRKLGAIYVLDSVEGFIKEQKLGPDAMQIDKDEFKQAIGQAGGSIKLALMKQERIAGIGNIYSDEILFQTKIHPKQKSENLDDTRKEQLYKVMQQVLETAIDAEADPAQMPKDYLLQNRDKGGQCPKCGTEIRTIKVSGRTAYYCPKCQSN